MSPSSYLVAIPAALVALGTSLARWEDSAFLDHRHMSDIQWVPRYRQSTRPPHETAVAAAAGLDTGRYAAADAALTHSLPGPPWDVALAMAGQEAAQPSIPFKPTTGADPRFPPIGNYKPDHPLPPLVFQPVNPDSAFYITANEVTKQGQNSDQLIFKGVVHLTSPQFHLSGDQLIVRIGQNEAVKLADATGHVEVRLVNVPPERIYRGESERATYDPATGKLVLSGWPKVQGKARELVASDESARIVLFPQTGKLLTEGRTQTHVARNLVEGATGASLGGAQHPSSTTNVVKPQSPTLQLSSPAVTPR